MKGLAERVSQLLNSIVDPCSRVAGVPTGLVDMGMVSAIEVGEDGDVRIELLMTEAGCLMSVPFTVTATDLVEALPGVRSVTVTLNTAEEWTEDRMSPRSREELAARRAQRRVDLGMPLRVSALDPESEFA